MSASGLRVAFDVTPVISGRTGIARYVTELGLALERSGIELRRFAAGRSSYPVPPGTRHIRVPMRVLQPWWRTVPWPPIERIAGGIDVVHATGLLIPPTRLPLIVTVHDVAAVRHPELHPPRHVEQQREQLERLGRATRIVAVSQTTADDLVHLGVPAERVTVARLGATPLPAADASAPSGRPPHGYLLTVGETSPRKGYPVLLRALTLATDQSLVIAGPPAGDEQRLRSMIEELGLSGRVHRLGPVTDSELAALYRGALALCFPSYAEGFGLPVLEAMAAGVPVVAREIPAARELAGEAALLIAADDPEQWAAAIRRIAAEPALRAKLSEQGRRRAEQFTWEHTAAATVEAYRLAQLAGADGR